VASPRTAYRSTLVAAALAAGSLDVAPATPAEDGGWPGGRGGPAGAACRWCGCRVCWQDGWRSSPASPWPPPRVGLSVRGPAVPPTDAQRTGR